MPKIVMPSFTVSKTESLVDSYLEWSVRAYQIAIRMEAEGKDSSNPMKVSRKAALKAKLLLSK